MTVRYTFSGDPGGLERREVECPNLVLERREDHRVEKRPVVIPISLVRCRSLRSPSASVQTIVVGLHRSLSRDARRAQKRNCFVYSRITGNYQMYETFDDTAAQVVLSVEPGDSIRRVAQRLQTPYETVRQAVNRLEDAGYLQYDDGLFVTEQRVRDAARELVAASADVSPPSIEEAYVVPQLGDWPFAFARIDAVYVWTQGGYQVGRTPDDYPLFLAVREGDVDQWLDFFDQFGLSAAFERRPREQRDDPLQVVLDVQPELDPAEVEGHPVVSREETIEYMQDNYVQFQSALSMLDRMYDDLDLGVAYRESERAQS